MARDGCSDDGSVERAAVTPAATEAATATRSAAVLAAFKRLNDGSIDDQASAFVRSFFSEFKGRVHEVLDLAADFKRYAPGGEMGLSPAAPGEPAELDEHAAHVFLERNGKTMSVTELRRYLREVDVDSNNKMSFLEHALGEFGKTAEELLDPKGYDDPTLEACAAQIRQYHVTKTEIEAEERRLEAEHAGAAGAAGVVARQKAGLDLKALRKRMTWRNKDAIRAASNERATKRAAEQRVRAELAAREAAAAQTETLRRDRARKRIADRSQAFRVAELADGSAAVIG